MKIEEIYIVIVIGLLLVSEYQSSGLTLKDFINFRSKN